MPICKQCNVSFPNRIVIDGKARNLQKRKYCLKCSPFGKHNTSQIHKLSKNGNLSICRFCKKEYIYNRSKGHTLTKCSSCMVNGKRKSIKEKAVAYKGGKCKKCNYNKCLEALEFHHIDVTTKEFTLSGGHCYSWERIRKELDKCEIYCCRCHREIHANIE